MTLPGLAAGRSWSRWLREDGRTWAFTVRKRASAAADQDQAAGQDQDQAAGQVQAAGQTALADGWLQPASRMRRALISALIGYFLFAPAITGVIRHVTPASVFILAGTSAFTGLVGWRVVPRDRSGLGRVPWAALIVLVALAVAVFAVGGPQDSPLILTIAAAACGLFTATIRPATFGAVTCGGASLIVTLQRSQLPDAGSMVLFVIVPPMAAYLAYTATKRNETVTELRQTRAELARVAVAEERLRIARDLHDLLGQSLSLITLKAELSRRMLDTDISGAVREMAELETVARQSLSDVREAVAGYRQPDLAAELGAARQLLAAAGLSCQITTPADLRLPASVDTVLAWTVREGITNVVRHARATSAGITVSTSGTGGTADSTGGGGRVAVVIADNGTGPLAGPAGSGLAGLGERVRHLGGSLVAGPAPAGGFRLQVTIPVREQ
jgi:two-component system sensor histidine kinase DesK